MARRRSKRQSSAKKTDPVEEDVESTTQEDESQESSTQDEEVVDQNVGLNTPEEKEPETMQEDVEKIDGGTEETKEDSEELTTNETADSLEQEPTKDEVENVDGEPNIAETVSNEVEEMQTETEALTDEKQEQEQTLTEVNERQAPNEEIPGEVEQMQTETAVPEDDDDKVAKVEVENQGEDVATNESTEKQEPDEEKFVPAISVEKEPTSPECYDDDKAEVPIDPEGDEGEVIIGAESPEFLKYWRAVLDNPHDFTNWTYLLQLVEQENKPPLARRAYNGFFKRYPLCYGYWKKFSEMEKRNGNLVRSQRILERGVRAIPLSIDLWVHMIDFYINFYKGPDAGKEKVRKVFGRAVVASGSEFRSEKLWNKYINWEQDNKNWNAVVDIYDKVLRTPTQHYAIFFKDYKDFVMSRPPKDILSYQEFEDHLEAVRVEADESEKNKKKEENASEDAPTTEDDEAPPGVESNDRGKPPNEKELKAVSEKIISIKKKVFDETEALVTRIWTFEEGIKRPYFHVKALERTQIKNWRDYLEAEISREDNHKRVVLLFERCLIACALYEDFWLKYARYLVKNDSVNARNVYLRACEIHLPKKPNIHLHWATYEELEGNYGEAARILVNLEHTLPNMAMIKLRRVAIERRAGNMQNAEDLLKSYVKSATKGSEECFYIRKYVWFLVKVSNKLDDARQVLKDAIQANSEQAQLYKDLVGLEFSFGDEEKVIAACELALESQSLPEDVKFKFSQRKLEYMDDYGADAKSMQKAYDDHQRLYRSHKKRAQSISESTAQPATKKAKTEETSPVGGNKIMTTASARQYTGKPTTNGTYSANPVAAQPQATAQIQSTAIAAQPQAYQQTTATDPNSLYYQQYWNYQQQQQQKPAEVPQYNYSQWPAYAQQQYYQQ